MYCLLYTYKVFSVLNSKSKRMDDINIHKTHERIETESVREKKRYITARII